MTDVQSKKAEPSAKVALADVSSSPGEFDRVLDIPLTVRVELGRKKIAIGELLQMGVDDVLELGTPAGSPLPIFANQTLVAYGEPIIVGEKFGMKIVDIVGNGDQVRELMEEGSKEP